MKIFIPNRAAEKKQ